MSDSINRRQLQREAGRVSFNPQELALEGVGSAQVLPDGRLSTTLAPEARQQRFTLGNLFRGAGAGVEQLTPGQVEFGQQALGQGQDLFTSAAAIDPLDQAEVRFNRLRGILDRGRSRQRDSAESRLLAQGRLGGEGGARQLEGLEEGFSRADATLLDQLVTSAEDQRRGRLSDALSAGAAGQDVSAGLVGRLGVAQQGQQQLSQNVLGLLGSSVDIENARLSGQLARVGAIQGANQSNAVTGGQGGGFANIAKGVIGGGISGFLSTGNPAGIVGGGILGGLNAS